MQETKPIPEPVRRYALAALCVAAPIVLVLYSFNFALRTLTPDIAGKVAVSYVPGESKPKPAKETKESKESRDSKETKESKDGREVKETRESKESREARATVDQAVTKEMAADPQLYLRALHYRGETRYAAASVFIYLGSLAMFLFAVVVIFQRLGLVWLGLSLLAFGAIGYCLAFGSDKPRGRELVVERVLNVAESWPTMLIKGVESPKTGDIASWLVSVNTFVSMIPVGLLLVALAGLSVRPALSHEIDPDDLKLRQLCLRVALGLGSALFVIGVLANKVLVDWPLSLLAEAQNLALQPLAEAVTLQLGAMGTIAILAAFAPAITAWWLDVNRYKEETKKKAGVAWLMGDPHAEAADANGGKKAGNDSNKETESGGDEFVFAPMKLISAIMVALAPLLASPFADAIKSVLAAVGGK